MATHHLLAAAVSALSLVCAATYADTQTPIGATSQLVRFDDLNLAQKSDVSRLFNRVSVAADKVCGTRSLASHYNKMAVYEACYKDTVANVVAHIDRPELTAYVEQNSADSTSRKLIAQQ